MNGLDRFFILILALLVFSSCSPSASELVEQAEKDALSQRTQVARHLYGQVLREYDRKDEVRERALAGLFDLSLNQLHDYPLALQTADVLIAEFPSSSRLRTIRLKAAQVSRYQLEDPDRAMKYLEPLKESPNLSASEKQELGRTQSAARQYEAAEVTLKGAWDLAMKQSLCREARELQMDIMQVLSLQRKCPESLEWGEKPLMNGCSPDTYAVKVEMAQCYEFEGEPAQAIRIYEELIKLQPENSRVQLLLSNVKKRQKEKQVR